MGKPYYYDSHITIYNKDCRAMTELPDESVQMVCTSPPYWGLRKYSGEQELIWGDNHCEHEWKVSERYLHRGSTESPKLTDGMMTQDKIKDNFCSLCSAWKGAFGLEPTPELYIQHSIEILREVKRVLRKDGVVFWNIGDSYYGGGRGADYKYSNETYETMKAAKPIWNSDTLKPKDLCLIPFRLAIAAQEDGWWVRSVIIWSKPNPMPESVTDRPTESHEYILMLTKSGTTQYWTHRDGICGTRQRPKPDYRWTNRITEVEVAIEPPNWKEKIICPDCAGTGNVDKEIGWYSQEEKCSICNGKGKTTLWKRINLWSGHDYYWDADAVREPQSQLTLERFAHSNYTTQDKPHHKATQRDSYKGFKEYTPIAILPNGRNLRSVWEFPTQPYPEAHFAVFPEKLPELCIKAATPEVGCCSKCGAPWEMVVERQSIPTRPAYDSIYGDRDNDIRGRVARERRVSQSKTLGWQPTCKCQDADKVPSIVLDNFCGAGTTLWVAKKLGRRAAGYDIAEEYCELALDRNRQGVLAV